MDSSLAATAPPDPNARPPFSLAETLLRALCAPASLPASPIVVGAAGVSLVALNLLLLAAGALTHDRSLSILMICVLGSAIWILAIVVLVVVSTLVGAQVSWRVGAGIIGLASLPILLKLLLAVLFSLITSLSPSVFSVSPMLLPTSLSSWMARIDLFECWSLLLLCVLLGQARKHNGWQAAVTALVPWMLVAAVVTFLKGASA
jgi:hypothetical protein